MFSGGTMLSVKGIISDNNHELAFWREEVTKAIDSADMPETIQGVDLAAPWSNASLEAIERSFVDRYSSQGELSDAVRLKYEQFLGEGIIRIFGGLWVILSDEFFGGGNSPTFAVVHNSDNSIYMPRNSVNFALEQSSGHFWKDEFESNRRYLESFGQH